MRSSVPGAAAFAWRLTAAVLAASLPAASTAQRQPPRITSTLTKEAVAVRPGGGVPVVGQVQVGQRIDYVLAAMAQGSGGVPPAGIVDVLSPNQSYVPGSLVMPPGWSATPMPPYAKPQNQALYTPPPGAGPLSFVLPVGGGSLAPSPAVVGGDGMYPVPAHGKVYGIYHHQASGSKINCWVVTTLGVCPGGGWPRPSAAPGDLTTLTNFNGAVVGDRYIYFPALRHTGGGQSEAGLACWDAATDTPCAFQPAGPTPTSMPAQVASADQRIGGAVRVGASRVLITVDDHIYCYDKAFGPTAADPPCAGWTANGLQTTTSHVPTVGQGMDIALELGPSPQFAFVLVGGGGHQVTCVQVATPNVPCPGLWGAPKTALPSLQGTRGFDLHAFPDGSGAHGVVCLYGFNGSILRTAIGTACWTTLGLEVDMPTLASGALSPLSVNGYSAMQLPPGLGANRVFLARWGQTPLCVEFTGTGSSLAPQPCASWWPAASNFTLDYGYVPDPLAPDRCVLGLGHADRVYRFDGRTGRDGCPVTVQTTGDPKEFFCRRMPNRIAWSQIVIRDRPSTLSGGTIVVRDAATGAVLQTIAVVSGTDVYSIAGLGYPAHPRLTIEFTPTYSGPVPAAGYALEVQFTASEPPQICYQAVVDSCGRIYNVATFGPVLSVASSGMPPTVVASPWTRNAGVDLGEAADGPCPCPDSLDLSVRKTAVMPPWLVGGLGEFRIDVAVEKGTLAAGAPQRTFTDVLPPGLTYAGFSGQPDWTCAATGAQVTCTYLGPPVAAGGVLPPVFIAVHVVGPAGTIRNCAVLGPDADLTNNRSCVEVTLKPCDPEPGGGPLRDTVDIAMRKHARGSDWRVGGTGVWEIAPTVVMGTVGPTVHATFTDVLPPGAAFVSATGTGWTCTAAGQQVTCTYAGLHVSAVTPLPAVALTVRLTGPAGRLRNCAVGGRDAQAANDTACATASVAGGPTPPPDTVDLGVRKRALGLPWAVGGTGVYEIVATAGNSWFWPGASPTLVDHLPPGTSFAGYMGFGWTCAPLPGQQVSCTYSGGAAPPGTPLPTLHIHVNVLAAGVLRNCAVLRPDVNPSNDRHCVDVRVPPN